MKNHIIVCSMFLLLCSCVSVELPGQKIVSAKNVDYKEPQPPFEKMKLKSVDAAWISRATGNTISYISDCSSDPSLETIENDVLNAMNKVSVVKTDESPFNGRAARATQALGSVDGVPVKMSVLVFKRNGCNYTLSFGGTAEKFSSEESIFEQFKTNFRAP